ncbi:MAG TPA: hypothetical protein VGL61_32380 [Kofleriaceae bacterium]
MRLAFILAVLACCVQQRSERCKHACAREYECETQAQGSAPFDEKQCISVCSSLEASQESARVAAHVECVAAHPACSEALECRW